MSIGILTFHNAMNFGASLQSYALILVLQKKYGQARIINYTSSVFSRKSKRVKLWDKEFRNAMSAGHVRSALYYEARLLRQNKNVCKLKKGYADFNKRMTLTREVKAAEQINALGMEHLVLGSDQIWMPTDRLDPVFWGEGLLGTVIAYAASGIAQKPAPENMAMLKRNFNRLSVREKTVQTILGEADLAAELVLDPVLLVDKEELQKIARMPKHKGEYLFCYNLGNDGPTHKAAAYYAEQTALPLIEITGTEVCYHINGKKYYCASPEAFVGMIAGAKAVVTNSFHGVVLSLLYHKPFAALLFRNSTRVADLLEQFQIYGRIYNGSCTPRMEDAIDWDQFEMLLQQKKKDSMRFLEEAIQGAG